MVNLIAAAIKADPGAPAPVTTSPSATPDKQPRVGGVKGLLGTIW